MLDEMRNTGEPRLDTSSAPVKLGEAPLTGRPSPSSQRLGRGQQLRELAREVIALARADFRPPRLLV